MFYFLFRCVVAKIQNLPSGKASKPGDVVFAMNGKSIQINNTDAEGRLVLADAICYADTFKPEIVIDIATLTGACIIALGGACSAVFSTNNDYWKLIRSVSHETGKFIIQNECLVAHCLH